MRWIAAALLLPAPALALPSAPGAFCERYPSAPVCAGGSPACGFCHAGAPPELNVYGAAVRGAFSGPVSIAELGAALAAVEPGDADGDGFSNLEEIEAGTQPGDPDSFPDTSDCDRRPNPSYDVCGYDPVYAFKKLALDFCGRSPTWEELEAFTAAQDRRAALHVALDLCLATEFWRGKDGQLWELAHPKIRPLQAIKAGRGAGPVPLADYDHDFQLWVYTQSDGRDAREVLLADYFVEHRGGTSYVRVDEQGTNPTDRQEVTRERRAGLLTTRWNLVFNTMFTALPRLTAAQAFRSFLGLDIARLEGLSPVPGEPRDYDGKGVQEAECAVCHSTLDPLSYPFKNYQGLTGQVGAYQSNRIERNFRNEAPNITEMPEAGIIFGQAVGDLRAWAEVAANSDSFASALVRDYWRLLIGEDPRPEEQAVFQTLWRDFAGPHRYSVEQMLHDLIDTEVYGGP